VSNPYVDFYTGALQRIQALQTQDTNLASITICWLFFAKRPIRQKELLHALAFSGNNPNFEKSLPTLYHVLDNCAGLVVVDEIHDTVSLFHKSLDDFLEKSHANFFPLRDQIIGTTCVKYMSSDAFAGGPCIRPEPKSLHFACQAPDRALHAYGDRLVQYPLYDYAQRHWHEHVRGSNSETADIVTDFLADPNKLSAACQTLESLTPRTTGLHVAVRLLLDRSLKRHLELRQPDPNVKDNFGRTPLSYAAELNNVVIIDYLIDAGAILDFEDDHGPYSHAKSITRTPLSWAAFKGHLLTCQTLLQYGTDVNYQDSRGRSALSYAAESDSEAVARFLLQKGGLIDAQDSKKRTPLCWAAATGSFKVASLLLNQRANIHHADIEKVTPLLGAARAGSESLISSLVARGADVNSMSYSGDTPLSRVIEANLVESVRLLLCTGAGVNEGTNPNHPLNLATSMGSKDIVHLLISAGSNVDQRDASSEQLTPVAYAARNGWTDIVQLLLDKGANPNNTRLGSQSALSYAVQTGSVELVEMLFRYGADVNQLNGRFPYCEPLYLALGLVHGYSKRDRPADERMLNLLLSKGADPNQMTEWESWRENLLDSPLLHALQRLPPDDALTGRLVQSLLEHGARTDVVAKGGMSVSECAKNHSKDVQDMLRHYGAR
jgi:ankyrin repeat protein